MQSEGMETDSPINVDGSIFADVDDTVGDVYCFESDHVALKNNPDYHRLLRTICELEVQRSKALADLETLYEAQEQVLRDPVRYVERLQRTGSLGIPLPGQQKLTEVPAIDWKKYTSTLDFKTFGTHRQSARLKNQGHELVEDEHLQRLKNTLTVGTNSWEATPNEGYIRGRYKDESKPESFNKLWTPEEQQKLSDLLEKYPPEKVEAKRWRKIAAEFPNRNPQQIASRVQKYFMHLAERKLPVPGRVPASVRNKKASFRQQQFSWIEQSSTFMQKYRPPVLMREDEDDSCGGTPSTPHSLDHTLMDRTTSSPQPEERTTPQNLSDNEGIPEKLQQTAEYKELKELKKLRNQQLGNLDPSLSLHHGFKCDRCGCDPIVGVRWHCVDCPYAVSLDFCETCFDKLDSFETASHNSSHRIRPVKRTWNKMNQDQDYMNFGNKDASGEYNYLDPNYKPAV